MRWKFLVVLSSLVVIGCDQTTSSIGTETAQEICRAWEGGLFLPSRQDTLETAVGLNQQIQDHKAVCR
jgi:hypothetical protein